MVKPDNEAPTCQFVSPAPDTNVLGGNAIDFILQVDDVNISNDTIEVKPFHPSMVCPYRLQMPMDNPIYHAHFTLGRHSMTLSAYDEEDWTIGPQLLVIDSVPVVSIQQPLDGDEC